MIRRQFRRELKSPIALLSRTTDRSQDRSIAVPIRPPEGLDVAPTAGTKAARTWNTYIATANRVRRVSFLLFSDRVRAVSVIKLLLLGALSFSA